MRLVHANTYYVPLNPKTSHGDSELKYMEVSIMTGQHNLPPPNIPFPEIAGLIKGLINH